MFPTSLALFMIREEWGIWGGGCALGLGSVPLSPRHQPFPPVFLFHLSEARSVLCTWKESVPKGLSSPLLHSASLWPGPADLGSLLWPALTQAPICALSSRCAVSRNPRPFIFLLILVLGNQLLAFTELLFLSSLLPVSPFAHWSFVLLGAFPYPHVPAGAQRNLEPHFPEPFCISFGLLVWRLNIFNNIYSSNTYTALTVPVCNFSELQKVRSEQVWTLVFHIEILGAEYTRILNLLCTSHVPWQVIQLHKILICEMKTMALLDNIYPYNNSITLSCCVIALRKLWDFRETKCLIFVAVHSAR